MKKQAKHHVWTLNNVSLLVALAILGTISNSPASYCQTNNSFFGTSPGAPNAAGSSANEDSNPNAVLPGLNDTAPNNAAMGTDFSGDEKRMQKKYKTNIANAKNLIARGAQMMETSKDHNDANYKKGKILKEIGEKSLAELQANNPFPTQKPTK